MKIGPFRISSAKNISNFLSETIEYWDDPEWDTYLTIYESRILGFCFYRSPFRFAYIKEQKFKEDKTSYGSVNIIQDIDMKTMMTNYQDIAFNTQVSTGFIRQDF